MPRPAATILAAPRRRLFLGDSVLLAGAILLAPGLARAHGGHGLPGTHWHASDAWGFVALAAAIGVAVWLSRK